MAHQHERYRQWTKRFNKAPIIVGAVIFLWLGLLISPLGSYIATGTILGLIVVFFVLGCIRLPDDDFRK